MHQNIYIYIYIYTFLQKTNKEAKKEYNKGKETKEEKGISPENRLKK